MNSSSRTEDLQVKDVLLDAGPLLILVVLHYIERSPLSDKAPTSLIREARPELADIGVQVFENILARFRTRYYSQLALAEALRFREHSVLKRDAIEIRRYALDVIRDRGLIEADVKTEQCLEAHGGLVAAFGLTDAVHIFLLHRNPELVLLTDDARLRGGAGSVAHRVIVLQEQLAQWY